MLIKLFSFYFTGKPNLALSLTACVQTTQDVRPTRSSSSSNVTVLSPEPSHLKSPVPVEGFSWPNVSKLRSIYTSLECASLTPSTSGANSLSPGCRVDSKTSRIQRSGSLDQKLVGFGWTNLQNMKGNSDYCISAQATLTNNRTISVLEKFNTHPSQLQNADKHSNATQQGVVRNLCEKFLNLS